MNTNDPKVEYVFTDENAATNVPPPSGVKFTDAQERAFMIAMKRVLVRKAIRAQAAAVKKKANRKRDRLAKASRKRNR